MVKKRNNRMNEEREEKEHGKGMSKEWIEEKEEGAT